jgi:protein-S-isoprenylcysteine O-methyltransferase Ste14
MEQLLHIYLLAGLIVHKALWEVLKRAGGNGSVADKQQPTLAERAIKLVKLAILCGIVVQIWTPYVLPILEDPRPLWIPGVALYTLGLALALSARIQLGNCWADIESARILAEQYIVCKGIYRYVRHPIYAGDLLLLLGLQLCLNSWLVLAVLPLALVVAHRALREERMLVDRLPGYDEYCNGTKRFIPFLV